MATGSAYEIRLKPTDPVSWDKIPLSSSPATTNMCLMANRQTGEAADLVTIPASSLKRQGIGMNQSLLTPMSSMNETRVATVLSAETRLVTVLSAEARLVTVLSAEARLVTMLSAEAHVATVLSAEARLVTALSESAGTRPAKALSAEGRPVEALSAEGRPVEECRVCVVSTP